MFNFKKGALSLLLKLLVKALVLVYYAVFFLFFLVSIGFHVQVQSRHKRFVYRKRYSSTIHRTFSHFSFFIYCFYTFPLAFSFSCLNAVCEQRTSFYKANWFQNRMSYVVGFPKNDIFAPTSKKTSVIQTNPSPVPMELNLGL